MAAKDTDDRKEDNADAEVMIDMSQAAVKKMIAEARERGYITYDQLNTVLPPDQVNSEQIEDVMSMLSEMGINIIEDDEIEEEEKASTEVVQASTSREVAVATTETEKLDRTDDPVRMYLREMGSVELLSREGEIAIAKRIEAGRNTMIAGLCESPLTFQAITIWRDELLNEDILLRDVIDLETTFGRSMDEDGEVTFEYDIDKNSDLAENLKGHLLLTTGDIDNNVHHAGTFRMAEALIRANKRFDFFIFPGQRHGFGNMSDYWFWLRAEYFVKHLLGDDRWSVNISQLDVEEEQSR